jgi:hypothetical protein
MRSHTDFLHKTRLDLWIWRRVWGIDIPGSTQGRKLCSGPHGSCPSVASHRGPGKWKKWKQADPGARRAHARASRGLDVIVLRLFAFLAPDILKHWRYLGAEASSFPQNSESCLLLIRR